MNYKIIIAYDGSRYQGWQKNKNASQTIQSKIEGILSQYLEEPVDLIASGRTDKGVHALGQVANFHTKKPIDLDGFQKEVPGFLPEDIVIRHIEAVDERFHARFQALQKTYVYTLYKGYEGYRPVFDRKYVHIQEEALDIPAMVEASKHFLGNHDFKGFSSDKTKKKTERRVMAIQIEEEVETLSIAVTGDGFLYNMVRIMVGTLIEVGLGIRKAESIDHVLHKGVREAAGFTAPAQGLRLESVTYKNQEEN